jgi:hypothetical protein
MANEDLFEGLQILSPQEIENSIGNSEDGRSNDEPENNESSNTDEPLFTIEPVTEKEEVVDKDKTVTTTTTNTNSDVAPNEAIYKALIKEMYEGGVITLKEATELETLPGTKESLKKLLEDTADEKVKQKEETWKKSFTGAKKRFLEIEDAFDDTDKAIIAAQRLEFFDNIDDTKLSEDVNLQKNLYFEHLISKGLSKEEAIEAITDAEEVGKLEAKAKAALPSLKQFESQVVEKERVNRAKMMEDNERSQSEMFEKLLSTIDSKEAFIDGLPLNKVQKDKLKANITTPVHKDENGREYTSLMYKQMKNPAQFEMLINYFDTIGLFNIDKEGNFKPDITKIKNVAKTQAVSELDKVIADAESKGVGINTSMDTSDRTASILNALEGAFKKK